MAGKQKDMSSNGGATTTATHANLPSADRKQPEYVQIFSGLWKNRPAALKRSRTIFHKNSFFCGNRRKSLDMMPYTGVSEKNF
jgi:hypothetical protein